MLKNKIISLALTGTIILGGAALANDAQLIREEVFIPISAPMESQYRDILNHWAHDYILNLETRGVLTPILTTTTSQNKFDPNAIVTISEVADMLDKIFDFTSDEIEFDEDSILKFIFENTESNEPITRMALARAITESFPAKNLSVMTTLMFPVYNDIDDFKPGEAGALSFVFNANIMRGYPDGNFKPYNPVTRAEVSAVLNRTLDVLALAEPNDYDYIPGDFEVIDQHLRMKGMISEVIYDEDNNLYKIFVLNMGDESQPYDKVYAIITDDTVIIDNTRLIIEDPSKIVLEAGQMVNINFADVPVAMIYPVRIPAEVIVIHKEGTGETTGIRLPVMDEYNMLMTQLRTLIGEIEDEESKEYYIAQMNNIQNTRDSYNNKVSRLEKLIYSLTQ